MENKSKAIKGGEFLIRETDPKEVFIPEEFDEEQKMIAETCHDFIKQEIDPNLDRIDNMENDLKDLKDDINEIKSLLRALSNG